MSKDNLEYTLKKQLIKETALRSYNKQDDVKPVINALIELIIEDTIKTGKVVIPELGSFIMATRSARPGRNPKTGESINIPETFVIRFRVSKKFKDMAKSEFIRQKAEEKKAERSQKAKERRAAKVKAKQR